MSQKPFDLEDQLQRHGRSLRRLAFELVHDGTEVDDALQETWLRVLRHPPQRAAQAEGWLATVLRHVVFRSRRGERRRRAREQAVARDAVASDPGAVAAQTEVAERLLAVVRGLEESYRSALWQRYFEDLPPREIAAREGVPLATVKSRLQRGLHQLRERLGGGEGEGGESAWRRALAVAFGFGVEQGAAAAGTAAAMAGGVCMAAWLKVGAAAVAAGLVLWWWWPMAASPGIPGTTTAGIDAVAAQSTVDRTAAAVTPERQLADREVAAVTPPVPVPTANVRGRCVDANGTPLSDCVVKLGGEPNITLLDEWLRDHPAPDWRDLECTTGADGVFAFTCSPPPPMVFTLRIARTGSGPLQGSVRLAPDAIIDVGDVPVLPGVQVVGLVVDREGRPVPDREVVIGSVGNTGGFGFGTAEPGRAEVEIRPPQQHTRSGADARFRLPGLLAPGRYTLSLVQGSSYADPHEVELRAERPLEDVTLVCSLPADTPTIRGHVVDEHGIGIARAWIQTRENRPGPAIRACSGDDGSFAILRADGDPDAVTLVVATRGHAQADATQSFAWGTAAARLVLERGDELVIRVVDERDRPVADYSVRALPEQDRRVSPTESSNVRARGPFENGTATVTGITPGTWRLAIEFPTASRLVTDLRTIEVGATTGRRVDIRAETAVSRTLRVVTTDGSPVVGTRVEQFDYTHAEFGADTDALPLFAMLGRRDERRALLVASGSTDAAGCFPLRGSPARTQGLRILGSGHLPLYDAAISLMEPGDLVVTVHRGARLVAHVIPPEGIDELRRRAGLAPGAAFAEFGSPHLQLSRDDPRAPEGEELLPKNRREHRGQMDANGRCELEAILPGTWRVGIAHWRLQTGSQATLDRVDLTEVTLADGASAEITLDLTSQLPGTLDGHVLQNGVPLANETIVMARIGDADRHHGACRTDADGRFRFEGPAGTYSLRQFRSAAGADGWYLVSANAADVFVGQTTHQTFELASGRVRFTLLDPDGAPAAGIELSVDEGVQTPRYLAETDVTGVVEAEFAAGNATVQVLPQRLLAEAAQDEVSKQAGPGAEDPLGPYRITLGTVTVRVGGTTAIELRLPPAWRQ